MTPIFCWLFQSSLWNILHYLLPVISVGSSTANWFARISFCLFCFLSHVCVCALATDWFPIGLGCVRPPSPLSSTICCHWPHFSLSSFSSPSSFSCSSSSPSSLFNNWLIGFAEPRQWRSFSNFHSVVCLQHSIFFFLGRRLFLVENLPFISCFFSSSLTQVFLPFFCLFQLEKSKKMKIESR